MLQFLSHLEEVEVNERILTTILCKPGVSVPDNLHHDAGKKRNQFHTKMAVNYIAEFYNRTELYIPEFCNKTELNNRTEQN
jgi:hypothetical protein